MIRTHHTSVPLIVRGPIAQSLIREFMAFIHHITIIMLLFRIRMRLHYLLLHVHH